MSDIGVFWLELSLCLAISGGIILTLRPVLTPLLVQLCGTEQRAAFWGRFTALTMTIAPLLLVLRFGHSLDVHPATTLRIVRDVLWYTLIGQFVGLLVVGQVIRRYIPTFVHTGE